MAAVEHVSSIIPAATAPVRERRSPLSVLGSISPAFWTLIALVAFWEVSVRMTGVAEFILPSPSRSD